MGSTLYRHAYQRMIDEDLAWLMKQPRSMEREHIADIVRLSPDREYEPCGQCGQPRAFCRDKHAATPSDDAVRDAAREWFQLERQEYYATAGTVPPDNLPPRMQEREDDAVAKLAAIIRKHLVHTGEDSLPSPPHHQGETK